MNDMGQLCYPSEAENPGYLGGSGQVYYSCSL